MNFPRKRFGQHFLIDRNIIEKIVQALDPQPNDNVVEIGPGKGALTAVILARIDHLQVIEIDHDLSEALTATYPSSRLTLHAADALRVDFSALTVPDRPLRICGNLPYNISTPLLFHLLSFSDHVQDMVFMLQKEVVQRMCTSPNSEHYGRLSVMIQYACQTHSLFDIKPNAFFPPPKVMSRLIHLIPYSQARPFPLAKDFVHFSYLVAKAFQQRRKTLKNALEGCVSLSDFEKAGIDPTRRPQTLSISEFVKLSDVSLCNPPSGN